MLKAYNDYTKTMLAAMKEPLPFNEWKNTVMKGYGKQAGSIDSIIGKPMPTSSIRQIPAPASVKIGEEPIFGGRGEEMLKSMRTGIEPISPSPDSSGWRGLLNPNRMLENAAVSGESIFGGIGNIAQTLISNPNPPLPGIDPFVEENMRQALMAFRQLNKREPIDDNELMTFIKELESWKR